MKYSSLLFYPVFDKKWLQLCVIPTEQIDTAEQHQAGYERRAAKTHADRDDEDVQNDGEVDQRTQGCGSWQYQQKSGHELGNSDEFPIKAGAVEAFEKEADRRVNAQNSETISQDFGQARRKKSDRKQNAKCDREPAQPAMAAQLADQILHG